MPGDDIRSRVPREAFERFAAKPDVPQTPDEPPKPYPAEDDWKGRATAAEYNFGVQVQATRDAEQLAENWREEARKALENADYYRGLLVKIGEMFGEVAYISDDGSKQDSVLVAKVPELVRTAISPSSQYARNQPCGCITCMCMDAADRCSCGGRSCGKGFPECVFRDGNGRRIVYSKGVNQ